MVVPLDILLCEVEVCGLRDVPEEIESIDYYNLAIEWWMEFELCEMPEMGR